MYHVLLDNLCIALVVRMQADHEHRHLHQPVGMSITENPGVLNLHSNKCLVGLCANGCIKLNAGPYGRVSQRRSYLLL